MEESDLETIGITSSEHRKKILDSAKALPQLTPIGNQSTEMTCNYWSWLFVYKDNDALQVHCTALLLHTPVLEHCCFDGC